MKILIKTIPHSEQRYETVGDWYFTDPDTLIIPVTDTGNWKYDMAVAVHELVEVLLCKSDGIEQKVCDRFDMKYESEREHGKHDWKDEPGDDPKSPYHKQHGLASSVERMLIAEFGENWKKYEDKILSFSR